MESKMIEKLEAKGFKRWTKGNYDRLYVNAEDLGLECECYNGGNIRYAELDGEKISNSWARELKKAKTFIDVKTGEIHSDSETLKEKVEEIIDQLNEYEEDKERRTMRNFKELTATVEQTGETFVLFDGEEFQNFDRLHELVGSDYEGLNDDLMDGITEWGGTSWKYNKYENAEAVLTIRFDFESSECVLFGGLNECGVVVAIDECGMLCIADDNMAVREEDTPEKREEFIQTAKEMLVQWRTDAGMKSDYYNDDYHIISAAEYDELDEDEKNDWQPIDWM